MDDCQFIQLPTIVDSRGHLSVIEGSRHVPFEIRRVYYLYDVPMEASRGGHAHKKLEQVMVAVSGSMDIIVDDGRVKRAFRLDNPRAGLYLGRMIWREMSNFSPGAVCLVLASDHYDEADYYRDYEGFVTAARQLT